jgi:hypothetical protein
MRQLMIVCFVLAITGAAGADSIEILQPADGDCYAPCAPDTIRWTSDVPCCADTTLVLYWRADGDTAWTFIGVDVNDGSYPWVDAPCGPGEYEVGIDYAPEPFVSDVVTFTVADSCGGGAGALDIKPGSCPNPFNFKSNGVLPVAVLGGEGFDVASIDPSSIGLEGVSPLRWSYEDVGAPVAADADSCDCSEGGPDGYEDLTLKFRRRELVAAIGPATHGEEMVLTLTGAFADSGSFRFQDCIVVLHPESAGGPTEETPEVPRPDGEDPAVEEPASWGMIKGLYR